MSNSNEDPTELKEIASKLHGLTGILNQIHLTQRFELMGSERVLSFVYDDKLIKMHLPFALDDHIQRAILRGNTFFEDQLLKSLRKMELFDHSGIIFDIGANIGNHTVYFSKILGAKHVTSFEPQNVSGEILRRNIELNELDSSTTVVQSLVGSKPGSGRIKTHFGNRNLGATAFSEDEGGHFAMTSLDHYFNTCPHKNIDFIKIDVEGMQKPLFDGAKEVIGDLKPVLWVELREFKSEFDETNDILKAYGYRPTKLGAHDFVFTTET